MKTSEIRKMNALRKDVARLKTILAEKDGSEE